MVFGLSRLTVAASIALLPVAALADPVSILFVGNSITHGRYPPALNYHAGPGSALGSSTVHDLLCPSLPCTGVEGVALVEPTSADTPGASVLDQLGYLQATPTARYTEVGPFGGVAGIFLQFTREAGLDYKVSLIAVSSATLAGYAGNTGSEAGALPLIASANWQHVVLQDQTFEPLPTSITVNGKLVSTRGSPSRFQFGVTQLIDAVDAADKAAGAPLAQITLAETPPLAAYGYTSNNPNLPIFGSSTAAQEGGNPAYAPYVGDPNPMASMAADLHSAYVAAASAYATANPSGSQVDVSLDGDAWVTAIDFGIAQRDPFLDRETPLQLDLWDSNALLACCTTPIGYHPSVYGDLLNAYVLFGQITGLNPTLLVAEYDPFERGYPTSASKALGIAPLAALELAVAAEETLVAGGAVTSRPALPCWQPYLEQCRLPGSRGGSWPF